MFRYVKPLIVTRTAGRFYEPLLILVLRRRGHDPIREEPVAGELVEPPARRPDPAPDGGDELVHDLRELLELDRLFHQQRRLPDVRGHHEHLQGRRVDDRVEELLPLEALLPVRRRVRLQELSDPRSFLFAVRFRLGGLFVGHADGA